MGRVRVPEQVRVNALIECDFAGKVADELIDATQSQAPKVALVPPRGHEDVRGSVLAGEVLEALFVFETEPLEGGWLPRQGSNL